MARTTVVHPQTDRHTRQWSEDWGQTRNTEYKWPLYPTQDRGPGVMLTLLVSYLSVCLYSQRYNCLQLFQIAGHNWKRCLFIIKVLLTCWNKVRERERESKIWNNHISTIKCWLDWLVFLKCNNILNSIKFMYCLFCPKTSLDN